MKLNSILSFLAVAFVLTSCYNHDQKADGPGANFIRTKEYAPAMYHSEPYEGLTQIKDSTGWFKAGTWSGKTKEGYGEFYNSAPHARELGTNMLEPVEGTIKRGSTAYSYKKDELEVAAAELTNPMLAEVDAVADSTEITFVEDAEYLAEGKALYGRMCKHCHGEGGEGDGNVAEHYPGVANLKGAAIINVTQGHIYHVITKGKGRMASHASQISPKDRWKIANYVKQLQSK